MRAHDSNVYVGGADGDGSDRDGGEDGSMGQEADSGAGFEVEGGADGSGEAAASAAAVGSLNDDDDDGAMGPYADSGQGGMRMEADAGTILKNVLLDVAVL